MKQGEAKIIIHSANETDMEDCLPARTLVRLLVTGKLQMTLSDMNKPAPDGEQLGNCHNISKSLMMELLEAGVSEHWWLIKGGFD